MKYLVPYYRVSTDDKGQDPERQRIACEPWAEREGFHLLPPTLDIGTSASKIPALHRPLFHEVCQRAQASKAAGIIMETPDRFSRFDPDLAIWEKVEVERKFNVRLYFACMSREMQETPMGKCFLFMQQAAAHQWVEDHRKKVLSGNVRARARGQRLGRMPKAVSFEEERLIVEWRKEHGWEKIAQLVTAHRGAHLLTDAKERRRQSISASALKRWWRAKNGSEDAEAQVSGEMHSGPGDAGAAQTEAISDGGV